MKLFPPAFRPVIAGLVLTALFCPTLRAIGQLRIQDDILPTVLQNRNYQYQLKGQGGTGGPYTFTCPAPCQLPPNYSFSSGGLISYTFSGTNPTRAGLFFPGIVLGDGVNPSSTQTLRLGIIKAESWNSWCPRGHYGGDNTAVATSPLFSTTGVAVAGSSNGVTFTSNGGQSWNPVFSLGPLPTLSLATDQCASPIKFWALTGSVSINQLRNLSGPFAGTVSSDAGSIYRVDGLGVAGTVAIETSLPANWTGSRRRIKQAYSQCTGEMLASDNKGGVLYRNSSGIWSGLNGNLPSSSGQIIARDMAYGDSALHTRGAVLVQDVTRGVSVVYTVDTALLASWAKCADLPALSSGAVWQSLALTPDGRLVAGSTRGDVRIITVASCGVAPSITAGPAFMDGATPVTPAVNGFIVSPCYSTVKELYAVTQAGIFKTGDISNPAANPFLRQGVGLLSESLSDLGVSNACGDGRLIVATHERGIFFGDANGFCPAQTGQDSDAADFNSFTDTRAFVSPTASACGALSGPIGLHAGSRSAGLFRVSGKGHELAYAGATREKSIVDLDSAFNGTVDVLYAATNSGVYQSLDGGLHYAAFYPTDEPLLALRGAPGNSIGGAYAISSTSLFAAGATPPWSRLFTFPGTMGKAADLFVGGPLTASPNDDTVWIAYGLGGLLEFHTIAGAPSLIPQSTGLNGFDVRVVSATQTPGVPNLVYLHAKDSFGNYRLLRGVKPIVPDFNQQVNFTALTATGLPVNEEAIHIVVESKGLATAGYVWVLLPHQGLYISTDGGSSFSAVTGTRTNATPGNGMPPNFIPIALIPARDFDSSVNKKDVAVLVAGKGVYYSNDGGNNYCFGPTVLNQVPVSSPTGVVPAAMLTAGRMQTASVNYAAPPGDVVASAQPNGGILALTTSTSTNDILLAGTNHGVFYSGDAGANWENRSFADQSVNALLVRQGDGAQLAGSTDGIWRSTDWGASWAHVYTGGSVTAFTQDGTGSQIAATLAAGSALLSTDAGLSFAAQSGPTDGNAVDFNASLSLTTGSSSKMAPNAPAAVTASYWMAGAGSGANYSGSGGSWTTANGSNDYSLTGAGGSWAAITTLGGTPSKVLIGNNSAGLYRTLDGGDSWRVVSGTGSGLEATSKNAAALVAVPTAYGTTDALVGMVGSANGGIYLSGDNGEHWTQINQGYDPNNLSITSLVKTSCSGCPVQYYSGSYGGGMYTRTVSVVPPPTLPGVNYACFGTPCTCVTGGGSGPEQGGQAFQLCGSNFQNGLVVEFDGIAATGCTQSGGSTITCTGTPPHFPGSAVVRVRNPDTRMGTLPANYTYTAGTSRASNLYVAKSSADASLTWSCAGCSAPSPARVYRSQNALFSLYLETYNGGIGGAYTNTGAVASAQSYFWNVE